MAKSAVQLGVFEDRHVGITSSAQKVLPAAKNSVIAQGETEDVDANISERVTDAVNELRPWKSQPETAADDTMIGERMLNRFRAIARNEEIGVQKPERITASDRGAGVHLRRATAVGAQHDIGVLLREGAGLIVTAAVDDNNLGLRRDGAQVPQEILD